MRFLSHHICIYSISINITIFYPFLINSSRKSSHNIAIYSSIFLLIQTFSVCINNIVIFPPRRSPCALKNFSKNAPFNDYLPTSREIEINDTNLKRSLPFLALVLLLKIIEVPRKIVFLIDSLKTIRMSCKNLPNLGLSTRRVGLPDWYLQNHIIWINEE